MPQNIEWACHPECVEDYVYAFRGRLYKSKQKAMIEWKKASDRKAAGLKRAEESETVGFVEYWSKPLPPVYELEWKWRELDASEYKS